jgi:hypothetical protein
MKRFATAYDTTQCSGYVLDRLEMSLKAALVAGALSSANEAGTILQVQGGQPLADAVPEFAHPWAIESEHTHAQERTIVFDARPFGAFDRLHWQFVVRNEIEYRLQMRSVQLNDIWVNDDPALLRDVSPVAMSLFASWVSENVARRFALDPREQLNLAIFAAIHYLSLFLDDDAIDTGTRMKLAMQVSRALRCPAEEVLTMLEKLPNLNPGITAFCEAAADATGSVRLQQFNPGILISIVKGTWFGINAAEMLAVAHPLGHHHARHRKQQSWPGAHRLPPLHAARPRHRSVPAPL